MLQDLIVISLTAILIENFVLVKFLGICPFLGVSKKVETATGMGMAVTFVMIMASIFTWAADTILLKPYNLEYMRTIAFILIILLVQLLTIFAKGRNALFSTGIYLPLITTNCAVLGVAR